MKIFIKNMVCTRCEMAVARILDDLHIPYTSMKLGEVDSAHPLSDEKLKDLNQELRKMGFEILGDAAQQQMEAVKNHIVQEIAGQDIPEDFMLSEFVSSRMNREYSSVSKLFSQHVGITLEQYFILQKIEKIKELLFYNEYTVSEIAVILGYKSVQHLSAQFKNTTGLTPTQFKKLKENTRKTIDSIHQSHL